MSLPQWKALSAGALTAAAVSAAVAPFIRKLMIRAQVMDIPCNRSSHETPIPRGGGWACILGTVSGLFVADRLGQRVPWGNLAGAVTLGAVGFADDRWNIRPAPRLLAQAVVGAAMGPSAKSAALGSVFVPTVVNAVNFMDGINGITALTTGVWGAHAIAEGNEGAKAVGAALAGAMIGYLPHNLRKNRLFLGDVGSYFIGGVVALTALNGSAKGHPKVSLLAPLGIYFADTGATLINRATRGENIASPHREHVYQKLANEQAWGHAFVSIFAATSSLVFSVFALKRKPVAACTVILAYLLSPTASQLLKQKVQYEE